MLLDGPPSTPRFRVRGIGSPPTRRSRVYVHRARWIAAAQADAQARPGATACGPRGTCPGTCRRSAAHGSGRKGRNVTEPRRLLPPSTLQHWYMASSIVQLAHEPTNVTPVQCTRYQRPPPKFRISVLKFFNSILFKRGL